MKHLLFLLQSVSWTAQPKYNTQSVAVSNDFVAKIFLKLLLRTYSEDLIWDLFTGQASKPLYKAGKHLAFNSSINLTKIHPTWLESETGRRKHVKLPTDYIPRLLKRKFEDWQ